jgi:hypothetical protein
VKEPFYGMRCEPGLLRFEPSAPLSLQRAPADDLAVRAAGQGGGAQRMSCVAIGSLQGRLSPAINSLLGFRDDKARQSPMKRFLIAVLAALTLTSPAAAVTQNLGTLDTNGTDFSRGFVRLFGLGSPLGAFSDFYTFDLVQSAVVTGGVIAFDIGFVDLSINSVG